VGQSVVRTLLSTLLLWAFNSWRPRAVFSLPALRELFGFGSRLLASSIIDTVFRNIYNVVIGKLFAPADLGYYTRAYTLQQLPAETLSGIVGRVTFPLFSELQDDTSTLRKGLRKALCAVALVNTPLMIGLLVCARPLVLTLLTEKWAPAIAYLQLLCIVGLSFPLQVINLNVLLAQGHSDLYFRLEVIKKVLLVALLAITWRWGIEAIIIGRIVFSLVAYFLNTYYTGTILGYGIRAQARDLLPYLGAAAAMGASVFALTWLPIAQPIVLLLIQVIAGSLIYGLLCLGLRLPVFMDGWHSFRRRIAIVQGVRYP
jgi:O-antigen/teichoic acid export membrane protein